jgi:hypothetical protein
MGTNMIHYRKPWLSPLSASARGLAGIIQPRLAAVLARTRKNAAMKFEK